MSYHKSSVTLPWRTMWDLCDDQRRCLVRFPGDRPLSAYLLLQYQSKQAVIAVFVGDDKTKNIIMIDKEGSAELKRKRVHTLSLKGITIIISNTSYNSYNALMKLNICWLCPVTDFFVSFSCNNFFLEQLFRLFTTNFMYVMIFR